MVLQLQSHCYRMLSPPSPLHASFSLSGECLLFKQRLDFFCCSRRVSKLGRRRGVHASATLWENWVPEKGSQAPSLSDVFWPAAGAFVSMAILGKIDQILAPKGISITIPPMGAVCAVLFAAPSSPSARKYNMFVSQIGCAAFLVLSYSILGCGWVAKGAALASSLAFMVFMRAVHPPAASLPLLFIDGAKLHHLKLWYAVFPGAAGCIILMLVQQIVCHLKEHAKF